MNRRSTPLDVPGYTELVEIGRGGFAVVYRARRTAFDQTVAIKILTGAGRTGPRWPASPASGG